MDFIKSLREEFSRVQKEAGDVIELASKEARDLTGEEKESNEKRFARLEAIQSQVNSYGKLAKFALDNGTAVLPREDKGSEVATLKNIDRDEFNHAVRGWAHTGKMAQKYATIITTTASSILLPKSVLSPLVTGAVNTFREGFAAWGLAPMSSPGDTSTFNTPVLDPTAGGLVAENASSETENAPAMTESIVSTVKTYQSGSVYYSNLVLGATSFDLLGATVPHLSMNKELGLESAIAAAIIADAGITQAVTSATTSGFTYANSVSLANKLPKRYQSFKVRLLSATAFSAAEGLLDDNNRPVMVSDPQNQNLKKMHGTPTFRCDYLEAIAADKVIGVELSLTGFHLRDAGEGLARYDQVPAKPNQVGINLFGYHAYGYAVSAVAKLKTAVS